MEGFSSVSDDGGEGWHDDLDDLDELDDFDISDDEPAEEPPVTTATKQAEPSTAPQVETGCECTIMHSLQPDGDSTSCSNQQPFASCPCIAKFLIQKENLNSTTQEEEVHVDWPKLLRNEIAKRMLLEQDLAACYATIDSFKERQENGTPHEQEKQNGVQDDGVLDLDSNVQPELTTEMANDRFEQQRNQENKSQPDVHAGESHDESPELVQTGEHTSEEEKKESESETLVLQAMEAMGSTQQEKNYLVQKHHECLRVVKQLNDTVDLLSSDASHYIHELTSQHKQDLVSLREAEASIQQCIRDKFILSETNHKIVQSLSFRISIGERQLLVLRESLGRASLVVAMAVEGLKSLGQGNQALLLAQHQSLARLSEIDKFLDMLTSDVSHQALGSTRRNEKQVQLLTRQRDELLRELHDRYHLVQKHHEIVKSMALQVSRRDEELQSLRSGQNGMHEYVARSLHDMMHLKNENDSLVSAQQQTLAQVAELNQHANMLSLDLLHQSQMLTNQNKEKLALVQGERDELRSQLTKRLDLFRQQHCLLQSMASRFSNGDEELQSLRFEHQRLYNFAMRALQSMKDMGRENGVLVSAHRQSLGMVELLSESLQRLSSDVSYDYDKFTNQCVEKFALLTKERDDLRFRLASSFSMAQKHHRIVQFVVDQLAVRDKELNELQGSQNDGYEKYLIGALDDMEHLGQKHNVLVALQRQGLAKVGEMSEAMELLSLQVSQHCNQLSRQYKANIDSVANERDELRMRLAHGCAQSRIHHRIVQCMANQISRRDEKLRSFAIGQNAAYNQLTVTLDGLKHLQREKSFLALGVQQASMKVDDLNETLGTLSEHVSRHSHQLLCQRDKEIASLVKDRDELQALLTKKISLVQTYHQVLNSMSSRVSPYNERSDSRKEQLEDLATRALDIVDSLSKEQRAVRAAQAQTMAKISELGSTIDELSLEVPKGCDRLTRRYEEKVASLVKERDDLRMQLTQRCSIIRVYHRAMESMAIQISVSDEKLRHRGSDVGTTLARALEALAHMGNQRRILSSSHHRALTKVNKLSEMVFGLLSDQLHQTQTLESQYKEKLISLTNERDELHLQLSQRCALAQSHHRGLQTMAVRLSLCSKEVETLRAREADVINEGANHLRRCSDLQEELTALRLVHEKSLGDIRHHQEIERQQATELDLLVQERNSLLRRNEELEHGNGRLVEQLESLEQEIESRNTELSYVQQQLQSRIELGASYLSNEKGGSHSYSPETLNQQEESILESETKQIPAAIVRERRSDPLGDSIHESSFEAAAEVSQPEVEFDGISIDHLLADSLDGNLDEIVRVLAVSLQQSEMARADAIDKLVKERNAHADSIRHLSESMKRFYITISSGNS